MLKAIPSPRITWQVQEQITAFMASRRLRSGERLPSLRELTDALGVSRTSVREGLRALEALGMIEIKHGSGIYVADGVPPLMQNRPFIDESERGARVARELLDVRLTVEPEVCALAALRATEDDLTKLAKHVADFRKEIGTVDRPVSDLQFHLDLCRAAHNGPFMAIMEWIAKFYANSRKLPVTRDVDDHALIFEAVRSRDANAARAAMTKHLKWIGKVMEKHRKNRA